MAASPVVSDTKRQLPVKKYPGISITDQEISRKKHPPPETPPPGNSTAWIKRFWSNHPATGTGEKSVSSIEIRESEGEAVGVIFLYFSVYLLMYILYMY